MCAREISPGWGTEPPSTRPGWDILWWGAKVPNPVIGIDRFEETKRQRFLNADELKRLGDVLTEADRDQTELPVVTAAIRLLLLTGARYSEIVELQWHWVHFDEAVIRLPGSKTGFKVIQLNKPALEILRELPRESDWVFPGAKKGKHLVNLQKPWRRIRKAAELEDVKIHDLRHSYASIAVAGGLSLFVTGQLLGHSQPQTTARYTHLENDPLKQGAELVGRRIEDAWNRIADTEQPDSPK